MILLTGAAGFIDSVLLGRFADDGLAGDTVVVDDFSPPAKKRSHAGKTCAEAVERAALPEWLRGCGDRLHLIVHLGTRTDTMDADRRAFDELNVRPTKALWTFAARHGIPLVYASSAAVYGDGRHGFAADHALTERLRPLNAYGRSKGEIDVWALAQTEAPPYWVGLRFFNVYGPTGRGKRCSSTSRPRRAWRTSRRGSLSSRSRRRW